MNDTSDTQLKKKVNMKPKATMILDVNEQHLIKEFEKLGQNSDYIQWKKQQLPAGDILFQYGGKDVILLERKTLSDLLKSIAGKNDGRYKEQKIRIMGLEIPQKYYLVEGYLYGPFKDKNIRNNQHMTMLYGAIVHTTIRDRIPVIRTESLDDTVKILITIYNSFDKDGPTILANSNLIPNANDATTPYVSTLKPAKRDNMTAENCYLMQLMQIPGVSSTTAITIKDIYGSFRELLKTYDTLDDEQKKIKLLADITLPNKKRIGPAISKRIYEYLHA